MILNLPHYAFFCHYIAKYTTFAMLFWCLDEYEIYLRN